MAPRRSHLALIALLVLAAGCFVFPQPKGTADRPTLLDFDIEGTHVVSESDLRDRLVTQPSGRKYLVFPNPKYLDKDTLASDERRIVRYYQARGYYHARVESADVVSEGEGRAKLKVRISEGPPVRVVSVETPGLDGAPEAKARLGRLPLSVGDLFTEEAYDAAKAALLTALNDNGYAKAEVKASAQVDPDRNEAKVTYEITPGERYRFGAAFVAGAAQIPRARIRDEAEVAVKPGAVYDASDLARAQRRVLDLGVFGGVRVAGSTPDEQNKTIPVVVTVHEAPFRTIRAGPELAIQATSSWEADATVGWSHRNWLGGLRKLNLDLKVGYAWLPTIYNAQAQGIVAKAIADFTQPEFFTHFADLNLHGELERGRQLAYNFYAERLRVGLPSRLGHVFSIVPSFNVELYQLQGTIGQPNPALPGNELLLSTCPGQNPNLCLLPYFEQRLTLDLRDDPLNTTRGFFFLLSLQEGFSAHGNGAAYFRILPEARAFLPVAKNFVLAGRLRLGIINGPSGQELPLPALFTSGGVYMRGYYTGQFSPVIQGCPSTTVPCNVPVEYVPVGGAGLVDGGLELRFPIVGDLGGVAFLDFGNVTFAARDALDLADLQYAAGLGFRYKTPFGPVRLDIAARLPQTGGGQPGVQVLKIVPINGNRSRLEPVQPGDLQYPVFHHDPIVSVQFSVGEAF
ncbi:MAG TPA: BamA/TamA family outer membrane protein [Anaeromyxobacteraceae bacterium]|nr:BamA/TamA family outer membrane protein [Anaeromyxobacteraceae bacterium]